MTQFKLMKKANILSILFLLFFNVISAQNALIKEEIKSLKTYPFSDPNPIPILTKNAKIYPYFSYDGYSHQSKDQDWKVVTLENDFIEVYVTPQVGGKVWGAIEKSTGKEFIYRNEVMKFRNISMRGPWTSGGIEFNFGIIGHHPSTATPVDYVLHEHDDGSVSCTVGNIDLPSRTQWRVTIVLPKDQAAFETHATWYNPTSMNQAYYNWMTGAAPARSDFEFFTPGNELLKHSGQALPWPIDKKGRNLAHYNENNFGSSKSYHVVGEYNDFFGGYYHEAQYGFGHWGEYDAIPGQKLWLWALSRSGGIWENLLTDTDGQYLEFQAGRQFLQYIPDDHINPQTQANFEPYSIDQWKELWFPIKEIGGLTDVSESAVMHVEETDDAVIIGLNSFINRDAQIQIYQGTTLVEDISISLAPMDVFKQSFSINNEEDYSIHIPELDLHYTSVSEDLLIKRSFQTEDLGVIDSNEKLYLSGIEDMKFRLYAEAIDKFKSVLATDPYHIPALVGIAELLYRQANYDEGLIYANKALELDTYNPSSNYVAAIVYRAKNDFINAKEAFGWAARSMEFRSNAYTQMSEILLAENQLTKAKTYATKAIDFNQYNISAWKVIAITARLVHDKDLANKALNKIEKIDPINHFVKFERYLQEPNSHTLLEYTNANRSELQFQSYIELAIDYHNKLQINAALKILDVAPNHPLISTWQAFILQDPNHKGFKQIERHSPDFVFPFRRESLQAFKWVNQHNSNWKSKYYYALNLWAKDRKLEAAELLETIGDTPLYPPFYIARAHFLYELSSKDPLDDLQRANNLGKNNWRTWDALIENYTKNENWSDGLTLASEAYQLFPENYSIGLKLAYLLNENRKYRKSIDLLNTIKVLPFEAASEGRRLYESAHYWEALSHIEDQQYEEALHLLHQSKEWPENLGVGKPFNPDERIPDYMIAYCELKRNNLPLAEEFWRKVFQNSLEHNAKPKTTLLLNLKAKQKVSGTDAATKHLKSIMDLHRNSSILDWVSAQFAGVTLNEEQLKTSELSNSRLILRIANLD